MHVKKHTKQTHKLRQLRFVWTYSNLSSLLLLLIELIKLALLWMSNKSTNENSTLLFYHLLIAHLVGKWSNFGFGKRTQFTKLTELSNNCTLYEVIIPYAKYKWTAAGSKGPALVCVCMYVCACMYVCMNVCMYACRFVGVCVGVCACACVCACVCACILFMFVCM